MSIMKPGIHHTFFLLLLCGGLQAQLQMLEFPEDKRVISIEARIGYYWDLGSLPDSLQTPVNDFYKKLMKGPRADFAILYNWNDNFDVGFNYSYFKAFGSLDNATVIYPYANGSTQQFSGTAVADIRQQYFALRVDPSFELGKFMYLKPGVSSGVITYRSTTSIGDFRENIKGSTMAFELHLGLEYFVDNNWSINFTGSYLLAILHEPSIVNNLEQVSSENLSASLFKWYVGFGLRYNFTKKADLGVKEEPTPVRKPSRFD